MFAWYWLIHFMGVDYQVRYGTWVWYSFWSGFGGDVAILAFHPGRPGHLVAQTRLRGAVLLAAGTARVHRPRRGHHPPVLCRKHHPLHPGKKPVTADHIRDQYHLYLGKQRGKG